MSASENKKLALALLAGGPGRPVLAEDFVWRTARATAGLLNDGDPDFRGPDVLAQLKAISQSAYSGASTFEMLFCIAEGDWVVLQARMGKTTFKGEPYVNDYVFCVRCRDGEIAEVWEHADTATWLDAVVGRPEHRAELQERLRAARATLGAG